MKGKIAAGAIVATGLIAGGAMYYLQVYAFYERLGPEAGKDVTLVAAATEMPEAMEVAGFTGIDGTSSPLRYRGCFTTPTPPATLAETFLPYEGAEPLNAPGWFDCFDAKRIGADLGSGAAQAFLSQREIADGVDRVVAVYEDGRAFAWHQLNEKYRD
ncbi:DUF6446 family protein [Pseudoruegeria sp. SHC-113]|uniref:DUF6446 family protein n=1 Tax=Pseudoruegeria sp. SHC-113 TaxID=2855439 RepID=UPI0021BB6394|nr:DUF6446 family protein [Pseudoruegeria sp. SHC-113]MCT8160940.1 histidine kinase [Pseudoruegeria sp. SHC-113]